LDDVVLAEYEYLNTAVEEKIWTWRIALALTLFVLFGSVFFLAVLMERRNAMIDDSIASVIEEIRPRIEGEGLTVEYRMRSRDGSVLGKYIDRFESWCFVIWRRRSSLGHGATWRKRVGGISFRRIIRESILRIIRGRDDRRKGLLGWRGR
jgi:hypothetical protein